MKRLVAFIMAFVMCLGLCACNNNDSQPIPPTEKPTSPPTEEPTTPPATVPEETESEEERMQKLIDYNKAVDLINSLSTYFDPDQLDDMNEAYTLLVKLGNYKDVPELLSRFIKCNLSVTHHPMYGDVFVVTNEYGQVIAESDDTAYTRTFECNENGLVVKETRFLKGNVAHHITYDYNENGQLVREEITCTVTKPGEITRTYEYSCITYQYNAAGQLILQETHTEHTSGQIWYKSLSYSYNANGDIATEHNHWETSLGDYAEQNTQTIQYSYTYDENGLLIEKTEYYPDSDASGVLTYQYDEDGRVIKIIDQWKGTSGSSMYTITIKYSTVYFYMPQLT